MRVVEISSFGGPEVLKIAERPIPTPKADEVLIQVEACGVSRPDVLQRQGNYPPPPGASDLPGLEVAGVIAEIGDIVVGFEKGDRVCALITGGGYADFCVAPAVQALPIPDTWSAEEAATLAENLFTVYDMLVRRLHLSMGETVLVHGGTSGIGSTAIMLARALGAIPIATAGSEEKCAACLAFGAMHAINYKTQDFVEETLLFTSKRGADAVLDIVGGSYIARDIASLAPDGRVGLLAMQEGAIANIDLAKVLSRRISLHGAGMRPRSSVLKGEIARELLKHVWPLLPSKSVLRPIIDSTYPLEDASDAHRRMEEGGHIGKIVLAV